MEPINIAKVAHEANRAYCATLGDFSQLPWDDAPDWQKDSAFAGVTYVIEDPNQTPEMNHAGWMAHKAADGWIYGPEKDAEAKTHLCMVPYEDLPKEQRLKDVLFRSIVLALGCSEPVPQVQPVQPGDPNNPAIGDVYASMEIPDLVIKVTEFNAKGIGYTTRDGQNHFDLHGHFSPDDWTPCDPRLFDEPFEGNAEPQQSQAEQPQSAS
jgi:hypothetical protein